MKTNTRTAAAVQHRVNAETAADVLVICYPDDDRTGYHVKITLDQPGGGSAVQYTWYGAYMLAGDMVPLVLKKVDRLRNTLGA